MINNKDISELISRYEDAIADGKKIYLDADQFADIADYYDGLGDLDAAKELLEMALEIHPLSDVLLLKKAKLLVYESEYEEALSILEISFSGYDMEHYMVKIECFLQLERYEEAEVLIEAVLQNERKEQGFYSILSDIGFLYSEADIYGKATKFFEMSIALYPENVEVLADLSYAYEIEGNFDKAIESINKILDIDSYNYEAWVTLGKLYSLKDEYSKAAEAFDFALTIDDLDLNILKLKAHCLSLSDKPMEALLIFKHLYNETPHDTSLLLLLAECSTHLNLYTEAFEYLDRYREEEGDTINYFSKKIALLLQMDKITQALHIVEEAFVVHGRIVEFLTLSGEIKLSTREYELAEMDFKEAYLLDSDNFDIIDRLSIINIHLGRFEESIKHSNDLLALEPDNNEVKQRLALLYFEVDNKELFNKVLESFSDEELMDLFKLFYDPQQPELFDRKLLISSLNDAREYRTLFKNLKY